MIMIMKNPKHEARNTKQYLNSNVPNSKLFRKLGFGIWGLFRISSLRGFGLVEIIIVTAIVTTALVGFLQTEVLSVKLLRNERENLEAILLAQETIEAVRSI